MGRPSISRNFVIACLFFSLIINVGGDADGSYTGISPLGTFPYKEGYRHDSDVIDVSLTHHFVNVPRAGDDDIFTVINELNLNHHPSKAISVKCTPAGASCNVSAKCLNSHDVVQLWKNHLITDATLTQMCPDIIKRSEIESCSELDSGSQERSLNADEGYSAEEPKTKPSTSEIWGYGILAVTIISACSTTGVLLLPVMGKSLYKKILMFFISLGVGTLLGSAVFHLVPHTLDLISDPDPDEKFLNKLILVTVGIYIFFLTDRIMKVHMFHREQKRVDRDGPRLTKTETAESKLSEVVSENGNPIGLSIKKIQDENDVKVTEMSLKDLKPAYSHEHIPFNQEENIIAAVAWMILLGDGLHNFVDGLSIGAAFSDDIWVGVSISLAVFCEEFPHELGDFAILLNSGMTMKQAVFYNLASAGTCYIGLVVGILLGDLPEASVYIFGFAAGMFFYISLAAMMPEMANDLEKALKDGRGYFVLLLQNVGFIVGIVIMFIMAKYGGDIFVGNAQA